MLPLVITIEDRTGHKRRFAFADSPVRLGRSPLADLQLTEAFISRWEGTLRFDDKSITYFNLSSTNPTYVDGREVAANQEVDVSAVDQITMGELTLRFSRENVPEADLRRKGKRRPVAEGEGVSVKTVWLGALGPVEAAPLKETEKRQQRHAAVSRSEAEAEGKPASGPASVAPPPDNKPLQPESVPPVGPKAALRMPNLGGTADPLRGDLPSAGTEPPKARSEPPRNEPPTYRSGPPTSPSEPPARRVEEAAPAQIRTDSAPAEVAKPQASTSQAEANTAESVGTITTSGHLFDPREMVSTDALHAAYRGAFSRLLTQLTRDLEAANEGERAQLADQQQRRYPQITQEQEYRALLRRMGFEPRKADIPEISDWLRGVSEGLLPPKIRLDTGLTLVRILGLLEMLTQSFAEINDAQDQICRKWLGRPPRRSLLHSDNGRVILAYLLNPKADWTERLAELEEGIRDVVMHDLALLKATLEGAKSLIEALSPAALASAEGIPLEASEENAGGSFWGRLKQRGEAPEIRLWRRFLSTYENLQDGGRYQRVFLGRPFARTYLAAMGQSDLRAGGAPNTSTSSSGGATGGGQ